MTPEERQQYERFKQKMKHLKDETGHFPCGGVCLNCGSKEKTCACGVLGARIFCL